jgi:hypothetical protein
VEGLVVLLAQRPELPFSVVLFGVHILLDAKRTPGVHSCAELLILGVKTARIGAERLWLGPGSEVRRINGPTLAAAERPRQPSPEASKLAFAWGLFLPCGKENKGEIWGFRHFFCPDFPRLHVVHGLGPDNPSKRLRCG